jgi:two-component system chemotaxis sensor kinase CheA
VNGLVVENNSVVQACEKGCLMNDMKEIIAEFVQEGNEKADLVERLVIQLEKNPSSRESLTEIFRAMHSIKGATGFLGFTKLSALTHTGEALLTRLRDGVASATPETTSALLSLVDAMREVLSEIASTGQEGTVSYTSLVGTLARL